MHMSVFKEHYLNGTYRFLSEPDIRGQAMPKPPVYGILQVETTLTAALITQLEINDWTLSKIQHFELAMSKRRPRVAKGAIRLTGAREWFSIKTTKEDCLADLDECDNGMLPIVFT